MGLFAVLNSMQRGVLRNGKRKEYAQSAQG